MSEQTEKSVSGTATVFVGCKLPNGFTIEVGKRGDENYARYTLKGANDSKLIGGHGLTEVRKDHWDHWLKKTGRTLTPVKKGLIFAHESRDHVEGKAIDEAAKKTGFERINPKNPKELPKGLTTFNPKD